MTRPSAHSRRHARARTRRCALARGSTKALLGVVLAFALVLSPWESVLLSEAGPQLGTPPAAAQAASVVAGTTNLCPTGWTSAGKDESLCVLNQLPCPEESPLQLAGQPTRTMSVSEEFYDFCEDTILESESVPGEPYAGLYEKCAAIQQNQRAPVPELVGFVRKLGNDGGDRSCRAIVPAKCASGLHRVGLRTCRRYQRRTWTCPTGHIARNQFNTCYAPPQDQAEPHPACLDGAPQFVISGCAAYVNADFVRSPQPSACGDFDTGGDGTHSLTVHPQNNHWCQYRPSWLSLGCHTGDESCEGPSALCIMRASKTGGCDAIAHTIKCHKLQAAGMENIQREGCTPCQIFPFSPVARDACSAEYVGAINTGQNKYHRAAYLVKDDFHYDGCADLTRQLSNGDFEQDTLNACITETACLDPPHGAVRWHSAHPSGLVVINSPVIVKATDLVIQQKQHLFPYYNSNYRQYQRLYGEHQTGLAAVTMGQASVYSIALSGTDDAEYGLASWTETDSTFKGELLSALMSNGQCTLASRPSFRLIVEEMWPDNNEDVQDMLRLFGAQALAWWPLEREAQKQMSAARGFTLLTEELSGVERQQERERRDLRDLEIGCNSGTESWCRWVPQRAGYFRVTIAGAWHMSMRTSTRSWRNDYTIPDLNSFLANRVTGDKSDDCPIAFDRQFRRWFHRGCILKALATVSGVSTDEVSPADFGLNDDLNGLLSIHGGNSEAFFEVPRPCPAQDLRVVCGSATNAVNYTETAPVGIVVHEARVMTRQASAP